jgi:adenylylsulfate kinase
MRRGCLVTPAFAVWITGLPSSGKSTITHALVEALSARRVDVAVLESDTLRQMLTPHPTYSEEERDTFYRAMASIGAMLVAHGVPVIFDATANRRQYRAAARMAIRRFIDVHIECPLEVCLARDLKGIYRKAQSGQASTVPGAQASYEPPDHPDLVVSGQDGAPRAAARRIVRALQDKGYLSQGDGQSRRAGIGQSARHGVPNGEPADPERATVARNAEGANPAASAKQ